MVITSLTWNLHQFVAVLLMVTMPVVFYYKRIGFLVAALWWWTMATAAWVGFSPFYVAPHLPSQFIARSVLGGAQALFLAFALPMLVFCLKPKTIGRILCAWATIQIICRHGFGVDTVNGDTFASCLLLLVALAPIQIPLYFRLISGVSAAWFYGTTTIVMVCAWCAGLVRFDQKRTIQLAVGVPIVMAFFLYSIEADYAFSSNSRVEVWTAALSWWWRKAPWWGTGIGTWEWIGAYVKNDASQLFLWAHNDFVQMLFEGGYVGIFLLVCVTIQTLWLLRRDRKWLSYAGAYVACMLTYYPLHFSISQMIGLLILAKSIRLRETSSALRK